MSCWSMWSSQRADVASSLSSHGRSSAMVSACRSRIGKRTSSRSLHAPAPGCRRRYFLATSSRRRCPSHLPSLAFCCLVVSLDSARERTGGSYRHLPHQRESPPLRCGYLVDKTDPPAGAPQVLVAQPGVHATHHPVAVGQGRRKQGPVRDHRPARDYKVQGQGLPRPGHSG